MKHEKFFWLHIKKSAGISTRKLLQPHYVEVDRVHKPKTFIQAGHEEYNDILNNYRIVLGDYQFKRTLFAKEFLYPDNWDQMFSFAFSREPVDRCISMFYYLHHKQKGLDLLLKLAKNLKNKKRLGLSTSYDFDLFLDLVDRAHSQSESIYKPEGLHFSTHSAPMFGDITDSSGNILLTKVYRLENMKQGIQEVFDACGLPYQPNDTTDVRQNKNKQRGTYKPSSKQIEKIKKIYQNDFELYEMA